MNRSLEHQRTAQRAYEIWESEGCPEGRCEAHWREAERELLIERDAAMNSATAEQDMGSNDVAGARDSAPMRDTRAILAARPANGAQTR